jgi:glycosyltransferase involved in cell wall biosynthesis
MTDQKVFQNYVIISPVKDEEKYVETTIKSVLRQTVLPSRWIIVDDGSKDGTRGIVDQYAEKYSWISVLPLRSGALRQTNLAEIRAFKAGFELIRETEFDFIVKLDADLDLPPDYFERLMGKFHDDDTLGIASGVYVEQRQNRWVLVPMPDYHASGASKMVRTKCFKDIGGFVPNRGWETIDEIRAQTMGWKTRHFEELRFHHLKPEGSGLGYIRTNSIHGEIYYLTGGGKLFFALKVLHRTIFGRPIFLAGLTMLVGFLKASASKTPRLVSDREAKFYRELLNARVPKNFLKIGDWLKLSRRAWR